MNSRYPLVDDARLDTGDAPEYKTQHGEHANGPEENLVARQ